MFQYYSNGKSMQMNMKKKLIFVKDFIHMKMKVIRLFIADSTPIYKFHF